tara:strand:+ start:466 stop:903 length:438 start_codon:yes stop_codon:yes gene_type:complete
MSQVINRPSNSILKLISKLSGELIEIDQLHIDNTNILGFLLMENNKKIKSNYWVDHYPEDVNERIKLLKCGEWAYHMGGQGTTWLIKKINNNIYGYQLNDNTITPLSEPNIDNKDNISNAFSFISESDFHVFKEKSWIWNYEIKN